jgi:hypothetical protein
MDIFAGRVVKFPEKRILEMCVRDAVIFHEMENDGRSKETLSNLCDVYDLSEIAVRKIYGNVKMILREAGLYSKKVK